MYWAPGLEDYKHVMCLLKYLYIDKGNLSTTNRSSWIILTSGGKFPAGDKLETHTKFH